MRRREFDSTGSLDLFLDTICNAFGGIMFIAILLSVVTQLRSSSQSLEPARSSNESHEDLRKMDDLVSASENLKMSIGALRPKAEISTEPAIADQNARMRAGILQLEATMDEQVKLVKELESTHRKNVILEQELAILDENLEKVHADVQQKSGESTKLRSEKMIKIDLPRVRSTSKGNLIYVMRYGRCYFAYDTQLSAANKQQMDVEIRNGTTFLRPKANEGWDLQLPTDVAAMKQHMRSHSSDIQIVTIGVWQDSYEQFAGFKKILLELGFEYELVPLLDMDQVPLGPATGSSKVQ